MILSCKKETNLYIQFLLPYKNMNIISNIFYNSKIINFENEMYPI